MKLPRRAAALFAAFLMAVSLVLAPQPSRAWFIDGPLSNPPPRDGDPDTPDSMPQTGALGLWIGRVGFIRVGPMLFVLYLPTTRLRVGLN